MEPLNTKVENRGYTIFTRMNQTQIDAVLTRARKAVPYAIGVNNHMGSKATADRNTMELLTNSLKKQNLLFVDSGTSRNSLAYLLACQKGIPALKLTTYLDNPESSQTLKDKLREVVEALDGTHTAVVIGHDREETARLLSDEMARWSFQGVKFVRLNELLENH